MDEKLRIILIIIVSVSIFGLLIFVYVKKFFCTLFSILSIKSQFLTLLVQVLPDLKMDFPTLGNKFQNYISMKLQKKWGE